MEIGLYIAELLGEQDEVSVAGLGTFFKERVAGTYDKQSNLFYPPSYHLSFKEDVFNFSGLSEYISLKRSLSISSSEELIKKFTETILDVLNGSDAVEINHLGSLYKRNNHLTFKPSDSFGIADKFYGLKPIPELNVAAGPLIEQKDIQTEVHENKYKPENPESEEEVFEQAPKARLVPILMISFIAIIASLLALFYFDKSFNHFVKDIIYPKAKPAALPETMTDSGAASVVLDSIVEPLDSSGTIKTEIQEESKTNIEAQATVASLEEKIPAANQDISYEIIVAAFSRKIDAETYIKEMDSRGIKAKIVENLPGKMLKISLGTFSEEEPATIELNRIQKEINKDAWIARVKPLKNP
ncbi:MAG: SPOR domain-containing protein [Daejeonella sp.]|uniref:HU domain-containing protein n=1 Tax=Daejeonella sp. TaxID=2805397 RepID=UPI0027333827|nr:SPOR domain-containing protein [Daejeonella sp.]MDP3470176.1 SPOR domain-containing protein [Daejeonella sp.]